MRMNRNHLRIRISEGYDGFTEESFELEERSAPYHDPFSLLAAVVRGRETLKPYDPYSLENNMMAMEILDAAVKSAKTGKTGTAQKIALPGTYGTRLGRVTKRFSTFSAQEMTNPIVSSPKDSPASPVLF